MQVTVLPANHRGLLHKAFARRAGAAQELKSGIANTRELSAAELHVYEVELVSGHLRMSGP